VIDAPTQTLWYVYGIARADGAASRELPTGVADTPVQLLEHRGLVALAGSVDADAFSEEGLAGRLNDRAWLEAAARAHEGVLAALASTAAVVPLRFGVIFRAIEDVHRLLDLRRREFEADLEYVDGREEYGVKLWVDRAALAAAPRTPAPTGRAYLERKLAERADAESASERVRTVAATVYRELTADAVAAVSNRPQPRELTGRDDEMVLNAAYLVERARAAAFAAAVDSLAGEAAEVAGTLDLTGPWPPHNFVGARAESEAQ
jgi:hypothetical protein